MRNLSPQVMIVIVLVGAVTACSSSQEAVLPAEARIRQAEQLLQEVTSAALARDAQVLCGYGATQTCEQSLDRVAADGMAWPEAEPFVARTDAGELTDGTGWAALEICVSVGSTLPQRQTDFVVYFSDGAVSLRDPVFWTGDQYSTLPESDALACDVLNPTT